MYWIILPWQREKKVYSVGEEKCLVLVLLHFRIDLFVNVSLLQIKSTNMWVYEKRSDSKWKADILLIAVLIYAQRDRV